MKTLILQGSPNEKGHTVRLVENFTTQLKGNVEIFNAYDLTIRPCIDCRYCFKKEGCSITDDMQKVYEAIENCDNLIVASPMHFGNVSAPLFTLISRLQTYWSAKIMRNPEWQTKIYKKRYGALIATTGGNWFNMEITMNGIVNFVFDQIGADFIQSIYCKSTDKINPLEDMSTISNISSLAARLNQISERQK